MKEIVCYDHKPNKIVIENHDVYCDIWLAKNIHQEELEESLVWIAEEVYGHIKDNIPTYSDIENNFDVWYLILSKWEPEKPITLNTVVEDFSKYKQETNSTLVDLEDAILELGDIVGGI